MRLLLEARANIEARDKFGKTALCWAASQGNDSLVAALSRAGADKLQVTSYELQATSYQLQVTSYKLQVAVLSRAGATRL